MSLFKSNVTPEDASTSWDFGCAVNTGSAGERKVHLKKKPHLLCPGSGSNGYWGTFVV